MFKFLKNLFIFLFLSICVLIAIAFISFYIMRTYLGYDLFTVPSEAMRPNILTSDIILATPLKNKSGEVAINHGDIIFFKFKDVIYVKRIIGVPNEKIQILDGLVYINNEPLKYKKIGQEIANNGKKNITITKLTETNKEGKSYQILDTYPNAQYDNTMVFDLKADNYFVLGDNRDNSIDSRADPFLEDGFGFIGQKDIVHKGGIILFSIDYNKKKPLDSVIRTERLFKSLQ